jgi:hypothetical protein
LDPGFWIRDIHPGSRIPDPIFSILDPRPRVGKIPDPGSGSASKNLHIFNSKTRKSSQKQNQDVHPRSWPWTHLDPDPGVKKAPDPDPESAVLAKIIIPPLNCTVKSPKFFKLSGQNNFFL